HVDASSMSAAAATRRLSRLCRQAIEEAVNGLPPGSSVVTVVAAVPGTVDGSTQTVITAPNLHWTNFGLAAALGDALGLAAVPVTIGNDANFAALAEFWCGQHAGIDDLVYVTGDVGIGGGLAALAALASVGTWLGLGLSNLINLLGTRRVILGGYFAELSAWILPAAHASLAGHVFISQPIEPLVATSTLGPDAAATGAAL